MVRTKTESREVIKMWKTYRFSIILIVATLLFFATTDADAASMRCGTRLVSTGDTISDVRDLCGEPDNIEVWHRHRRVVYHCDLSAPTPGNPACSSGSYAGGGVQVEVWTYSGAASLPRQLRFENGVLKRIETGTR
jgi:hypothetical protein